MWFQAVLLVTRTIAGKAILEFEMFRKYTNQHNTRIQLSKWISCERTKVKNPESLILTNAKGPFGCQLSKSQSCQGFEQWLNNCRDRDSRCVEEKSRVKVKRSQVYTKS